MEILENNRIILDNIYKQSPNSVGQLKLEGNFLVYNNEMVDISEFNLNELMLGDSQFSSSLDTLSSEDVFRIIRLHAALMGNGKMRTVSEVKSEKKIEIIKQENPLMKSISLVSRPNGVGIDEFINIVDSTGENHLYKNDVNVNIFDIYDRLKAIKGESVTPDELISEVDRKLYEIRMTNAERVVDSSSVSEDFSNKMNRVNDPYKTDNTVQVMGNEQEDIAIVADQLDSSKNQIKTFDTDNGDLVINSHGQNVSEVNTTQVSGEDKTVVDSNQSVTSNGESTREVTQEEKQDEVIQLIPFEDFKKLYDASYVTDFTPEEKKNVELYYAFFGDLILYEDYLLPELREILGKLRAFVTEVEVNLENVENATKRQRELIDKRAELEEKGKNNAISNDLGKEQEYVKKLLMQKPDETGSIGTLQVLMFIVIIIAILSLISLYILN